MPPNSFGGTSIPPRNEFGTLGDNSHLLEVLSGRRLDRLTFEGEARAVAVAVTALLGLVPADNASHVGAFGGYGVQDAALFAIDGDLLAIAHNQACFSGRNVAGRSRLLHSI